MQTETTWKENVWVYGSLIALLLITAAMTGCNDESPGQCMSPGPSADTMHMQREWQDANNFYTNNRIFAEEKYTRCTDASDICEEEYQFQMEIGHWAYMHMVNKIPWQQCGALIYNVVGSPYDPEGYTFEINNDDPDGDGLTNGQEKQMNYNPCEAETYECENDGEADKDRDGLSNMSDPLPECNEDTHLETDVDCV